MDQGAGVPRESSPCPDAAGLLGFALGTLPMAALDRLAEHIDSCARCEAALAELQSDDPLVLDLRDSGGATLPAGDAFRRLEERVHGISFSATEPGVVAAGREEPVPAEIGPYRVMARIGRGGMGAVYKAEHVHLKKLVALKVLPADRAGDPRWVERFHREMEAVGRVDHPHVVRALDAGMAAGSHYLAMEYVEGVDLARLQRALGPFSVADACEIVRQAALGLQAIHESGLVHRDVKPSNLIVTPAGQVKILDLGLARFDHARADLLELTSSDQIVGTVDYLAPEQIRKSRPVDIRADIYGLGCTLYRFLAGAPPFCGPKYDTVPSRLLAHCEEPPPPVAQRRPDVPPAVAAVIHRMIAKAPEERFAAPADVAAALAPHSAGSDLAALVAACARRTDAARGEPGPTATAPTPSVRHETTAAPTRSAVEARTARGWSRGRRRGAIAALLGLLAAAVALAAYLLVPREETTLLETEQFSSPSEAPAPNPLDLPLDDLPAMKWHPLLTMARPPTEVFWPRGDGLSSWTFQPDLEQVSLQCNHVGLLQLGSCRRADYRIQIGIHQNEWSSGSSLFFGLHEEVHRGRACLRYQYLEIQKDTASKRAFALNRGTVRVFLGETGRRTFDSETLCAAPIPPPNEEQILEVTIRGLNLQEVRLGGRELAPLVRTYGHETFTADDFRGGFGIAATRCSCTVRSARFMRLEPVR